MCVPNKIGICHNVVSSEVSEKNTRFSYYHFRSFEKNDIPFSTRANSSKFGFVVVVVVVVVVFKALILIFGLNEVLRYFVTSRSDKILLFRVNTEHHKG